MDNIGSAREVTVNLSTLDVLELTLGFHVIADSPHHACLAPFSGKDVRFDNGFTTPNVKPSARVMLILLFVLTFLVFSPLLTYSG